MNVFVIYHTYYNVELIGLDTSQLVGNITYPSCVMSCVADYGGGHSDLLPTAS